MTNVTKLFQDRYSKEYLIKYIEDGDFDSIVVITDKDGYYELRNTFPSVAELNAVLDIMKFTLLLGGGYEE